jgi:hypothetical protein
LRSRLHLDLSSFKLYGRRDDFLRALIADILLRRRHQILSIDVNISHENLIRSFLIDEDIALRESDAIIMNIHLHIEVISEDIEQCHAVDIRVQSIRGVGEYENGPEEIYEDGVYDGIGVEADLDTGHAFSQEAEKLHDELLELQVIEDGAILAFLKDEGEVGIVDDILNLPDVLLVVAVSHLEAQLQVLIVENADVGLRVSAEDLDHPRGLH